MAPKAEREHPDNPDRAIGALKSNSEIQLSFILDDPLCFFRCCRGNPRAVLLAAREAALLVCCPAAFRAS